MLGSLRHVAGCALTSRSWPALDICHSQPPRVAAASREGRPVTVRQPLTPARPRLVSPLLCLAAPAWLWQALCSRRPPPPPRAWKTEPLLSAASPSCAHAGSLISRGPGHGLLQTPGFRGRGGFSPSPGGRSQGSVANWGILSPGNVCSRWLGWGSRGSRPAVALARGAPRPPPSLPVCHLRGLSGSARAFPVPSAPVSQASVHGSSHARAERSLGPDKPPLRPPSRAQPRPSAPPRGSRRSLQPRHESRS